MNYYTVRIKGDHWANASYCSQMLLSNVSEQFATSMVMALGTVFKDCNKQKEVFFYQALIMILKCNMLCIDNIDA